MTLLHGVIGEISFITLPYNVAVILSKYTLTARSLACWVTEMRKISTILHVYLLTIAFLHVAYRTSKSGLNDEVMDILAVLVGQSTGRPGVTYSIGAAVCCY